MFAAKSGRPLIATPNWPALRFGGCKIGGTELARNPCRIVLLLAFLTETLVAQSTAPPAHSRARTIF
jgi:hypothetical protein